MGIMDKLMFWKKKKDGDESDEEAPKAEEKKEEESKKGIVLDEKTMKVVTLLVLLVSDFDFLLTIVSVTSYFFAAGIFYLFLGLIGAFFMIYIGGCVIAARESGKFIERFKEKVDGNEIQGISTEDLNAALEGARIFWKGTIYEDWKKREACLKQLRLANDNLDSTKMTKDDCDILDAQLKEAEISGLALLVKKDTKNKNRFDDGYGQRMIDQYAAKLKEGRDALAAREGGAAGEAHVPLKPPPGNASGAAGGDAGDEEEVDPAIKAFHKEIDDARDPPKDKKGKTIGAPDDLLALNLEKAMRGELDTFRVPSKLLNDEGKIADQGDVGRALYMVCEAKGLLGSYHTVSRQFSRRIVKPAHSVPFYRLMEFGWQPSVSHSDFAGILNANGLYSFTVGIPQLMFAIAFLASQGTPVEFLCASKDPNLPPVEGCPSAFNQTHWPEGTPCSYIPPSQCRGPYETCFQNRAPPATGVFGKDDFDASGALCDPTTFDVDAVDADGNRLFTAGTACGVGSCDVVVVGPDTCTPTRYLGTGKCTPIEDFMKQTVQTVLICCSFAIGIFSTVLSVLNIILDFPAQLFDIAEKEEEALQFTLKAEEATKTWEDKLHAEVQENIRQRLKLTKSMPRSEEDYKEREKKGELKKFDQINPIAPNEAPSLIITGVIELEKDVMQKKVGYIEHFMMMSEEEKSRRDALRKGITPGEEKEEEVKEEKEEKPKKEKSKAAAPKEVQIKGDTKLVIKEKTNKDRNLERAGGGARGRARGRARAGHRRRVKECAREGLMCVNSTGETC
jgi:hypothetical protein